MKPYFLATAGLVAALSLPAHAAPVACDGQPGSVSDPLGDAWMPGNPDIVCTAVQVVDDHIVLSQAFGAGFDAGTTAAGIYLDADQNAATGITDYRTPGLGIDFVAFIGGTNFATDLMLWSHTLGYWTLPGIDFQVFDDGYSVSIPLALLGASGAMDFAGVASTRLGANVFTGVQDFTAVGTAAVLSVPEPTSAALALAALGAVGGLAAVRRRMG